MKFYADCSFLFGDTLAPNRMTAQCLVLLAELGLMTFIIKFVAFIVTGHLLST